MPSVQEWLDENYPDKKTRENVKVVDLTDLNLTGDLDVSDFASWTKFIINGNPDLGEIIDRKEEKTEIIITVAQEWLDWNYPSNGTCSRREDEFNNFGKGRADIEELDISKQNLSGSLNLVGFNKLTILACESNQLTSLNLSNCYNLTLLVCNNNNQLANLILPVANQLRVLNCFLNPNLKSDFLLNLHPKKMTDLWLDDNLESQLKTYLQLGEKIGKDNYGNVKSTPELEPNEVNYYIIRVFL